jgi:hypothetical protein
MRAFWFSLHLATALVAQNSFREVRVETRSGLIEETAPFLAVGATGWDASVEPSVQIMVRASVDGIRWSRWVRMETAASPDSCAEASPRLSTRLVFFEWNSRYLEYQLGPSIAGLRFVFIDPGRTPERDLQRFRASRKPAAEAVAELTQPKYISRVEWGSPDGDKARGPLSYAPVQHLIVHHSADNYTGTDYAAWMRAIWNYHVFNNGWVDFGYNWAIAPDGTLYEGRAGGDNVIGAHFSCQNTGTMGVVLLGTFTAGQPTAEARATLAKLLAWKAVQREIDPLGRSLHRGMNSMIDNISGHRDGNRLPGSCTVTECPGNAFYPKLAEVRRDVADLIAASAARTPVVLWSENFDKKPAEGNTVPEGWSAEGMWRWWDGMAWFGMPETMTYEPGGAGSLVSPEFAAGQGADSVELRFRSWHDTETGRPSGGFDRKIVEMSVDGGEWQLVTEIDDRPRDWTGRSYKLAIPAEKSAEGFKLRIRFRFDTVDDVENNREGWFLDDIQVVATLR